MSPTASERAVSAAMWGVNMLWFATVGGTITALQSTLVPSYKIDALTRFLTRGQSVVAGCRWRAEVDPRVRPDKPYLFIQNHINVLDYATCYPATPHFKQGIELESHFKVPFYGWFMKSRGTLPVRPHHPDNMASLRDGMRHEVAAGRSLLAFPEGTRTRTGEVAPFRTGLFVLAHELQIEIVPVAVRGMNDVLSTSDNVFHPGKDVLVRMLSPMAPHDHPVEDMPVFAENVRQRIAAALETHP